MNKTTTVVMAPGIEPEQLEGLKVEIEKSMEDAAHVVCVPYVFSVEQMELRQDEMAIMAPGIEPEQLEGLKVEIEKSMEDAAHIIFTNYAFSVERMELRGEGDQGPERKPSVDEMREKIARAFEGG